MDKKQIGRLIRAARKAKGWSQRQLAAKFLCTQPNISDMEQGNISIDLAELERLATTLGTDLYYFFPREESDPKDIEQVVEAVAAIPAGHIRDDLIASMLAMALDARKRALKQQV
jgi:transcriptional regulator with XRE-family HTH domain